MTADGISEGIGPLVDKAERTLDEKPAGDPNPSIRQHREREREKGRKEKENSAEAGERSVE